jgi:hypothetical protein
VNIEVMAQVIYEDINPWRGGWVNASLRTKERYRKLAAKAALAGAGYAYEERPQSP